MGTASIYICVGFAASLLLALLLEAISRSGIEHRTIDDSLQTIKRIWDAASSLPTLPPEQRMAVRRAIAKDILLDITFLRYLIMECYQDDPPNNAEIRERTLALLHEIAKLNQQVRKSLFVFRFRPKLIADCQLIIDALEGHCRVWIRYLQLLKSKYPKLYTGISFPDRR